MKEKRRLERFDLKMPAKIESMTSDQEEKTLDLLTSNICSGGAFFHTAQPLREGTQVKIDLVLPLERLKQLKDDCKQAYIMVTGRVLRPESEGMAILFDKDYLIRPGGDNPTATGS